MKTLFALVLLTAAAPAATIQLGFTPNLAIPDNNPNRVADTRVIDSAALGTPLHFITSVEVTLNLTTDHLGDYYVYVQHDSGFTVLLNRPGRTASNDLGYADKGTSATFTQFASAIVDVHMYRNFIVPAGGTLEGLWQPDGRTADPVAVTDQSPRSADLTSFGGLDADGAWTIFVADRSGGGLGTLNGWSLKIDGYIPEPASAVIIATAGSLTMFRRRRPASALRIH